MIERINNKELNEKIKALLITVGGTPDAIKKSIENHKPEFVVFMPSDSTVKFISDIVKETESLGYGYKVEITHNENDLSECYNTASKALALIFEKNYKNDEIAVDYTGGTKNMTAAAALASVDYGVFYSYVGGERRTKDGVGIVIDGTEKVFLTASPWDLLAATQLQEIKKNYNNYHFYTAYALAFNLSQKAAAKQSLFKRLSNLMKAYYLWDEFNYKESFNLMKEASPEVISEIAEDYDKSIKEFSDNTKKLFSFLSALKKSSKLNKYTKENVVDMIANAKRRAKQGEYINAILRLYRSMELWVQWKLLEEYRIDTSNVKEEDIPDNLKGKFEKNKRRNKYELGLYNSLILLAQKGCIPAQTIMSDYEDDLKDLMKSRNSCPLEHQMESRDKKDFERLLEKTLKLIKFENEKFDIFPVWK